MRDLAGGHNCTTSSLFSTAAAASLSPRLAGTGRRRRSQAGRAPREAWPTVATAAALVFVAVQGRAKAAALGPADAPERGTRGSTRLARVTQSHLEARRRHLVRPQQWCVEVRRFSLSRSLALCCLRSLTVRPSSCQFTASHPCGAQLAPPTSLCALLCSCLFLAPFS